MQLAGVGTGGTGRAREGRDGRRRDGTGAGTGNEPELQLSFAPLIITTSHCPRSLSQLPGCMETLGLIVGLSPHFSAETRSWMPTCISLLAKYLSRIGSRLALTTLVGRQGLSR
jgi:hypothetical protein